jgi:hypothetical protein
LYDVPFDGYSMRADCIFYGITVPVSVNVRLCTNSSTCDGNCSKLSGNAGTCVNQTTFSSMITCWAAATSPALAWTLLMLCLVAFL